MSRTGSVRWTTWVVWRMMVVALLVLAPIGHTQAQAPAGRWSVIPGVVKDTQAPQRAGFAASATPSLANDATIRRDKAGRLHAQVVVDPARQQAARNVISRLGGAVTKAWPNGERLQCWLPRSAVEAVVQHDAVYAVERIPEIVTSLQGAPRTQVGASDTEGLAAMNADVWHQVGFVGQGVRVGIIDSEYLGLSALLGTEIPEGVVVRNFVDGQADGDLDTGSDARHGVACVEIIYDIAPAAELCLAKIATPADFFQAVNWMMDQEVDIISTSFGFFNETPGDGTGLYAAYVQQARDAGILWATAAGNERAAHWGGPWLDEDGDGMHEFAPGVEINWFGPEDGVATGDAFEIPAGKTIKVYIRWDAWTDVTEDFALVLYWLDPATEAWQEIAHSNLPQSGRYGQTPKEYAKWDVTVSGTYGYGIERVSGHRAVHFETYAPKLEKLVVRVPERSLVNLADAPSAVTVGALDVADPWAQEWYSSEGPTNGPGGTADGGAPKPDICGYANVSTASYGATYFKGTSSATPHTAGAAALLLCAFPGLTVDQLEAALLDRAIDMGEPGMDTTFGAGRVHLGDPPDHETPEPTLAPQPTLPVAPVYLPMVVRR